MARSSGSAGVVVAGLTAAALAVIAFFAFQASAAQDNAGKPSASQSSSPSPGASDGKESPGSPGSSGNEKALPAKSGKGTRVVYSVRRHRVWLVDRNEKVTRTFEVAPSPITPPPGAYKVSSRSSHVMGSDGVPIENVVRFADVKGVTIGFSAAVDGSMPDPDGSRKTGGIRERRADGEAMWLLATIGTKVVVLR